LATFFLVKETEPLQNYWCCNLRIFVRKMARGGIEPPTRGFSVRE
jgi:hypothetical protein